MGEDWGQSLSPLGPSAECGIWLRGASYSGAGPTGHRSSPPDVWSSVGRASKVLGYGRSGTLLPIMDLERGPKHRTSVRTANRSRAVQLAGTNVRIPVFAALSRPSKRRMTGWKIRTIDGAPPRGAPFWRDDSTGCSAALYWRAWQRLDRDLRDTVVLEAQALCGPSRNIEDAVLGVRATVIDLHGHGLPIFRIGDPGRRAQGKRRTGCGEGVGSMGFAARGWLAGEMFRVIRGDPRLHWRGLRGGRTGMVRLAIAGG